MLQVQRALGSAVTNGRLIVVSVTCDSSIFAFSAASFSRCIACGPCDRSMPWPFLNSVTQPVDDPLVPVVAAELRCRRRSP